MGKLLILKIPVMVTGPVDSVKFFLGGTQRPTLYSVKCIQFHCNGPVMRQKYSSVQYSAGQCSLDDIMNEELDPNEILHTEST